MSVAEPRGLRPIVAHCNLGLGKTYRRAGRGKQLRERLTKAQAMYREMDMALWASSAEAELLQIK